MRATAPAFSGRTFTGKVASIDSRVDMNTRSVIVRALLANEDGALKPGMFLNVALANDERESLLIPEEALTPEAERQYVFVVADGKAQRREVRIGARRPGSVEVLAGLTAGEQVIVEGTQKVRDGAPVRATEIAADAEPLPSPRPRTRPAPPRRRASGNERGFRHDDLRPVGAPPGVRDGDVVAAVHPRRWAPSRGSACANSPTSTARS